MKFRNVLLLAVALLLAGGLTIYAETVGKISFNKYRSIDSTVVDGKVYLDLQDAAEKLHAMVVWDKERQAPAIYKPNVNITIVNVVSKAELRSGDFQDYEKGKERTFHALVTVDSLEIDISELRITLSTPYDDRNTYDQLLLHMKDTDENFPKGDKFLVKGTTTYTFQYAGKYYVRFWVKPKDSDRFYIVGEKALHVK